MKIPEKIYINGFSTFATVPVKECVEYTRTDAFIKKACDFIKDNGSHYIDIVNGQLVLKKGIIKDFKKYMEGE